jgi:hypothetical protein
MNLSRLNAFVAFWYDFIVGDDWRVALGVVLALAVTYVLAQSGTHAVWWIAPLAVAVLLPLSIRRAARKQA